MEQRSVDWIYMLPSTALHILQSLFSFFYDWQHAINPPSATTTRLSFELRHLHAVSSEGTVVFSDVSAASISSVNPYTIDTRLLKSHRPSSFDEFSNARLRSMKFGQSTLLDWDEEEVLGPNVEDRESLLVLAKMTNNAYIEPEDDQWYDLGGNWTDVRPPIGFMKH